MAEKLSRQDQSRLLTALDEISDLLENGSSPNDAVVKVAQEHKIPAGHVRPLIHALNTGRANFHRKTAESVLEKASSISLADPDIILERLYPSQHKSAATYHQQRVIAVDYDLPPPSLTPSPALCKQASDITTQTPPAYPREDTRDARRIFSALQDFDRLCTEKEITLTDCQRKLASCYQEVDALVRRNGLTCWSEVRANLEAGFGAPARMVCQHLERDYPQLQKQAQQKSYQPLNPHQSPYRELCQLLDQLTEYRQHKRAYTQLRNDPGYHKLAERFRPWTKEAKKEEDGGGGGAGGVGKGMGKLLGGVVKGTGSLLPSGREGLGNAWETVGRSFLDNQVYPDMERRELSGLEDLMDPQHEAMLLQARTKAMLHDFLANDPVISEYDPEEVLRSFNELQQMAPYAISQPALVRAVLRKYLAQGGVDTHELGQLTTTEKELQEVRSRPMAAPGTLSQLRSSPRR